MNKLSNQDNYKNSVNQLNVLCADTFTITDHKENKINYKNISVPDLDIIEEKKELLDEQEKNAVTKESFTLVKVHKLDNKTILEGEADLFIFKEPSSEKKEVSKPILTQIPTTFTENNKTKHEVNEDNIFLMKTETKNSHHPIKSAMDTKVKSDSVTLAKANIKKEKTTRNSSSFIIAALFLLIVASTAFILQEANILNFNPVTSQQDKIINNGKVTDDVTTKISDVM